MGVRQMELCQGCGQEIEDQFLLRVGGHGFHERCLFCSVCLEPLKTSCFLRGQHLYCKRDYDRLFTVRCGGCSGGISAEDLVMKAHGLIYHVQCFTCSICGRLLNKGDHFLTQDSQIYCQYHLEKPLHYLLQRHACISPPNSNDWLQSSDDESFCSFDDSNTDLPKGPKRPRTILTTSQRRKFKASFEVNPKPCRKVRETLAAETGLSVRVVQVWFQNQRAKMKKIARRQTVTEDSQSGDNRKQSHHSSSLSTSVVNGINGKTKSSQDDDDKGSQTSVNEELLDQESDLTDGLQSITNSSSLKNTAKLNQAQYFNTAALFVDCSSSDQLCGLDQSERSGGGVTSQLDQSDKPGGRVRAELDQSESSGLLRLDQLLNEESSIQLDLTSNPIDKLYSMQSYYFNND